MTRDAATPVLLALLLGLVAAGSGLALAATVVATWLAVVLPSIARARPVDAVVAAAVAVPFLAALARAEGPGAAESHVVLLVASLAASLAGCAARPAGLRAAVVAAAAALTLLPVLASAGLPLPRAFAKEDASSGFVDASAPRGLPDADDDDGAAALARRPGALAPARGEPGPFDAGAGWRPVPAHGAWTVPAGSPALFVVGRPSADAAPGFPAAATSGPLPARVLDLDPYDVLWLPEAAALADEAVGDGGNAGRAEVAASFARRGGLLVGPPPPARWPEALERRLGPAGRIDATGPAGARPFGAGRLARASSPRDVAALLDGGRHHARVSTAFDRALSSPSVREGWDDPSPPPRSAPLPVLAAFAVAAAGASALRGIRRAALRGALSLAAFLAVLALVPAAAPVRAEPFRIDLAGAGGRRVEGLLLTAGPRGWVQEGPIARVDGGLRLLGFRAAPRDGDLRLALRPLARAWVVEESVAGDPAPGLERATALPAWATTLVVVRDPSAASPARVRSGRAPYEGPRVPGVPVPATCRAVSLLP